MFLSLKGSLNTKFPRFKGILDTYAGASAAYSLRRLSRVASSVVRVRRASDNSEKDFSATDVSSGAMTGWVNSQIVPPLDIRELDSNGERTGALVEAAAAYSLRNLSSSYTGNVVVVRRSSDDAEEIFTAAEVADGTLTTWVGAGNDGYVVIWYDQSGNGNDAVQDVAGSQPKIVDGGSLVTGGLDFDGVDDGLFTVSNLTDTFQSATIFALTQDNTTSGTASMVRIRPNGIPSAFDGFVWEKVTNDTYGSNTLIEGANAMLAAADAGQGTRTTTENLNTLIYQPSQILAYENGTLDATLTNVRSGSVPIGDVTLVDQLWIGQNFDDNARPFNGTMSEVIIYFTDQSDNRTAIEANIGETYGIDLPSGVDTGYDQVDGFVEAWYDQSGNGNDATQSVAGSQPKIVDAGVLVSGGIYFDGVDDRLTCSSLYSSDISIFNVATTSNTVNTGNFMRLVQLCDGSDSFQLTRAGSVYIGKLMSKNTAFQSGTTAFEHGDINGVNLISAITSSTDTDAYIDGSLQPNDSTGLGSGNDTTTTIGARDDLLSSSFFAGSHAEIIIYDSDQSANREAIEANINNQYDIY